MGYNASKQKSPIIIDLWKSPFIVERNDLTFHFSSETHMNKFNREVKKREEWLCDSFFNRFGVVVDAVILADVQLYQMIEGRGFAIESFFGDEYDSPEQIKITVGIV